MAEAMVDDTIPCHRCNTQIHLQDWVGHIRKCSTDENNRTKTEKRITPDNESDVERIPCEYCDALISVDDWKDHSEKCSDSHRRRIEDLRNGTDNEPADAFIPCEYCDNLLTIHDWERHTRQCAGDLRRPSKKSKNDEPALIPCEYCNTPVSAHEWAWHTKQCAGDLRRPSKKSENDEPALIPCEYCNTPVSAHEWAWHTKQCADGLGGRPKKSEDCNGESALIPCEYCNTPVSLHEWQWHTNKCAQAEKKRIADLAKRIANEPSNETVPCEHCNKSISVKKYDAHQKKCQSKQTALTFRPDTPQDQASGNNFPLPEHWDGSATKNLTRFDLVPGTVEYQFVADNFHKTLQQNAIVKIQRIQNRRWYRQYDAHKDDFIERYGNSTEQWLFHGCRRSESADAIILDCFNRSHAVNCAVGQGIYFAAHAAISHGYTHPDAQRLRHMFMARVLVGKTTRGNASTRVCPPGFDTTGGGDVFVTYHDAQAYGQYLIIYR